MTEQQPGQEQKKRAGSIRQYATLGRAKTPEHSDVQASRGQNAKTPEHSDVQASRGQNIQEAERSDTRTPERSDEKTLESLGVRTSERLDEETFERLDAQKLERPGTRTSKRERERHTIYLPPGLSKWVKHRAIDQECEISEIVTEALERYRAEG